MASAIVLLPLYIHNLSTAMYGALSAYMVFTMLVQIIVTFSFDTSVYIHFHEYKDDKKKLSVFISSAFIFMLLLGMVVTVVLSITGGLLFRVVMPGKEISFYPFGLAAVGAGVFQAIFKVYSNLLQSREKPETFFWSNVVSFTLIAIFTIVGLRLYPNSLMGPVMGRLAGAVIPCTWALVRVFREFGFQYNFTWLRSSFGFNAYSFIYQLQQWVINHFDKILMLFFLSLADVGVYDLAVKCLIPIELLMNGLHNSIYPKVVGTITAQTEKSSSPVVNRYYHGLTAITMFLICGSILFLPWAIDLYASNTGYQEATKYIPYVAVIYFFRCMRLFFTFPYGILKYVKPLPVIYMIISVLKILLMVVLIKPLNVYGVIVASVISAMVELVLLRKGLKGVFHFRFNMVKLVVVPMILFLLIVVAEPLVGGKYPYTVHIVYLVSCGGLLWWAYRNEIQAINPFRPS